MSVLSGSDWDFQVLIAILGTDLILFIEPWKVERREWSPCHAAAMKGPMYAFWGNGARRGFHYLRLSTSQGSNSTQELAVSQ